MTSKERLQRTVQGKQVDRSPVSFYELDGYSQRPEDPDPFNIYSHPSWKPLLDLTREKTDWVVNVGMPWKGLGVRSSVDENVLETRVVGESALTTLILKAGSRTLRQKSRRDKDVNTVWCTEPLLKNAEDLEAWLELPLAPPEGCPDIDKVLRIEQEIGDRGIVYLDTGDPICQVASLFEMGEYTVTALTEPDLMHRALQHCLDGMLPRIQAMAASLPGRLWRIYGPEYASPPYLPPRLFEEYVVNFDRPIVSAIQDSGGYARIHSHGRLKAILPLIEKLGADGLDPVEPPPQGDVTLDYVRRGFGKNMVLWGNLEISDIENLPTELFQKKIEAALSEGARGDGRGFVLMPSACPYGRVLSPLALANYEAIIERVERQ